MHMASENEEEKKYTKPTTQNLSPLQHTQGTDNSRMHAVSKFTGVSEILHFELSGLTVTPQLNEPILENGFEQRTE